MEIPKNIRQVGDIEQDLSLYLEDYVATFIEKLKRKNETSVGVLLGQQAAGSEIPCLFVRGAVLVKDYEIEEGRIVMTASAWNHVYEQMEACFQDVEVCGWFLCSRNQELTDLYHLQKSHNENFKGENQIFYWYDGNREEEAVYRFDFHGAHRLRGHYIYYERNEQMQEYMISQEPVRKTEYALAPIMRGTSDQAARQFRAIMETRKEETPAEAAEKNGTGSKNKKKSQEPGARISRALRTVSVTALLCGIGFGMAAWYKYDKMQGVRDVLAVLAGRDSILEETQTAPQESGQAVISEVPGNVAPTEASSEKTPESETQKVEAQTVETQETTEPLAEREDETGKETKQEASEAETEAADAAGYQEYVVKNGDTLHKICREVYGNRTAFLVAEICKMNQMDNADFIYEGQILKLPVN